MISVSYVQRRMRLLLTVALVVISQQASTFTLPRKVDEPFGGLLHTMVNGHYYLYVVALPITKIVRNYLFIFLYCRHLNHTKNQLTFPLCRYLSCGRAKCRQVINH